MTIVIFIIVLTVLIFVHELGHFLLARTFGIRVEAFAIGFGPRIFSWRGKETEYCLNIIPFGGYVKIFGEDPNDASISGPDAARSIVNKAKWEQIIVLSAGVLFNFLFAWFVYFLVFTTGVTASVDSFGEYAHRFENPRIIVTNVMTGSPAEKSGIKTGDVLEVVGVKDFSSPRKRSIETIQETINSSAGKPIVVEYARRGATTSVEVLPIQGLVDGKYAVGIAMQNVADLKLPLLTSFGESFRYTVVMIRTTVVGLYDFVANIFRGQADFAEVSGPVGIAGIVGDAASMGFTYLLMISALISINLGVINLVPFPALDGGRIVFVLIEATIRRRIPNKVANITNGIGFVLLMILMIAVTYRDVVRLFE